MSELYPVLPEEYPLWNWDISNGLATRYETQLAYEAIRERKMTRQFNRRVWNDLVLNLYTVLDYMGDEWDDRILRYEDTMMWDDEVLTKERFNSVVVNLERFPIVWYWEIEGDDPGRLGRGYVDKDDEVYGVYMSELTDKYNTLLRLYKLELEFLEICTGVIDVFEHDASMGIASTMNVGVRHSENTSVPDSQLTTRAPQGLKAYPVKQSEYQAPLVIWNIVYCISHISVDTAPKVPLTPRWARRAKSYLRWQWHLFMKARVPTALPTESDIQFGMPYDVDGWAASSQPICSLAVGFFEKYNRCSICNDVSARVREYFNINWTSLATPRSREPKGLVIDDETNVVYLASATHSDVDVRTVSRILVDTNGDATLAIEGGVWAELVDGKLYIRRVYQPAYMEGNTLYIGGNQ